MKQLFKCNTVEQFKIMSWLMSEGITSEDISNVVLLAADRVKVVNPAGQHMILVYCDGLVSIEQS